MASVQLQTEGLDLGLHLISYVAKRLTAEGRAHHIPVHVEPAALLALLLEALSWRNFCEVPLALGALAKDYGAIADDEQDPLLAAPKLWL